MWKLCEKVAGLALLQAQQHPHVPVSSQPKDKWKKADHAVHLYTYMSSCSRAPDWSHLSPQESKRQQFNKDLPLQARNLQPKPSVQPQLPPTALLHKGSALPPRHALSFMSRGGQLQRRWDLKHNTQGIWKKPHKTMRTGSRGNIQGWRHVCKTDLSQLNQNLR